MEEQLLETFTTDIPYDVSLFNDHQLTTFDHAEIIQRMKG